MFRFCGGIEKKTDDIELDDLGDFCEKLMTWVHLQKSTSPFKNAANVVLPNQHVAFVPVYCLASMSNICNGRFKHIPAGFQK